MRCLLFIECVKDVVTHARGSEGDAVSKSQHPNFVNAMGQQQLFNLNPLTEIDEIDGGHNRHAPFIQRRRSSDTGHHVGRMSEMPAPKGNR